MFRESPQIVFATFTAFVVLLFLGFTGLPFNHSNGIEDEKAFFSEKGFARFHPDWMLQPCNRFRSGDYAGTGYHSYSLQTVNLSCVRTGEAVSFQVEALEVPNRFVIKRNGQAVASSSWLGCTADYGPWGGPFCNSGRTTLLFTKGRGDYTLHVETLTSSKVDAWEIY